MLLTRSSEKAIHQIHQTLAALEVSEHRDVECKGRQHEDSDVMLDGSLKIGIYGFWLKYNKKNLPNISWSS